MDYHIRTCSNIDFFFFLLGHLKLMPINVGKLPWVVCYKTTPVLHNNYWCDMIEQPHRYRKRSICNLSPLFIVSGTKPPSVLAKTYSVGCLTSLAVLACVLTAGASSTPVRHACFGKQREGCIHTNGQAAKRDGLTRVKLSHCIPHTNHHRETQ